MPPAHLLPPALRRLAVGLAALACLAALVPATAVAQTPTPSTMVVEVPDPDQPDYLPGSTNAEFFGDAWAVFADGALCAEGETPDDGGFSVVLGEAGQPSECGTPGARVEFAGTLAGPFTFETTVALGSTVVLTNWAPYPTHTPFPRYVCSWLADNGADNTSGCQRPYTWAFAMRGVFADERVRMALISMMDVPWSDYAEPVPPANGDGLLLLEAAGVRGRDGQFSLEEVRTCRVWVDSDDLATRTMADTLSEVLGRVFGDLGLTVRPCERTTDPHEADLLLWGSAAPPVDLGVMQPDSFLGFPGVTPPSGPPSPADAGSLGTPSPAPDREGAATALVMLALTLAGAGAARAVARRP